MPDIEIPDPDEAKEKAEKPFTRMVALFVAIYAVGLAFASFGASNVTKELLLLKAEQARIESDHRQREQNEWNQFQSKSTRESLYRNEKSLLEAEAAGLGAAFPEYKKKLLESFVAEEARMKSDKDGLAAAALKIRADGKVAFDKIEAEYKKNERKDPYFDFAEVLFQLGIVLASVAMLAEKKWAFVLSLVLAGVALLLTFNGFGLFVAVPFLEGGH
jgi:fatty acid desaturase